MRYMRFALQEIFVVLWIVARSLVVGTRKSSNRVKRFPKRGQNKMRDFAFGSREDVDTAISRRRSIVGKTSLQQITIVRICLARRYAPMPTARDHRRALMIIGLPSCVIVATIPRHVVESTYSRPALGRQGLINGLQRRLSCLRCALRFLICFTCSWLRHKARPLQRARAAASDFLCRSFSSSSLCILSCSDRRKNAKNSNRN